MEDIPDKIAVTIANLENSGALEKLMNEALKQKIPVLEILEKGLRKGLYEVGRKFEGGEYFLAELLYGADMMENAMKVLQPHLKAASPEEKGSIVLGTVRGDIHDIGKNIFKMLAIGNGFEVHDLGVDVDPTVFVEKVREKKPMVIGISALLTTTIPEMKIVIDELKKAGLREGLRILLGGNAVTKEFGEEIGADGVAIDAVQGVNLCEDWIGK